MVWRSHRGGLHAVEEPIGCRTLPIPTPVAVWCCCHVESVTAGICVKAWALGLIVVSMSGRVVVWNLRLVAIGLRASEMVVVQIAGWVVVWALGLVGVWASELEMVWGSGLEMVWGSGLKMVWGSGLEMVWGSGLEMVWLVGLVVVWAPGLVMFWVSRLVVVGAVGTMGIRCNTALGSLSTR